MSSRIAPVTITKAQRKWLEDERERTGHAFSVIVRDLIQDKINKTKKVKA